MAARTPGKLRLAVIPGDGIGNEVVPEALAIVRHEAAIAGIEVDEQHFRLGAERYLDDGAILPEGDIARLREADAILFGAIGGVPGDPRLRAANIERELILGMRFAFDQYVNVRPCRILPGVRSPLAEPGDVDFLVVREGTEGPYVGNGGAIRAGTPQEVANETSVNTAFGVERVVRYAFERAAARRGRLTYVHKTNVLVHAGGLWQRTVERLAPEFPGVEIDYLHVDAAAMLLVTAPSRFDVVVTDNLFGDILTDIAAAIGGGIGLAASGNLNPEGAHPSMFEPVHGSAPDIAGTGVADPTAAILSAALLFDHLGESAAAERITSAVAADLAENARSRRGTAEVGAAICSRLGA